MCVCTCACVLTQQVKQDGPPLTTIQTVYHPVLLVVQEQYSDALQQLEQLLQRQPGNYTALVQLLTLLRRVGRVEEGEAHLHTAQDHVSRTAGTAGRVLASKQHHQRQALLLTPDILCVLVPWRMHLWVCHTTVLMRTKEFSLVHEAHLMSNDAEAQRICGAAGSVSEGFTCCATTTCSRRELTGNSVLWSSTPN